MKPEQRRQASRLFVALEYGEQLAHDCAIHQSRLVTIPKAQRFLRVQARQESVHATLFRQATEWLTPKHQDAVPPALQEFGSRLRLALSNNDLTESLLASQIVLEGFGEQILVRLNRGMDNNNIGFKRMRRLILHQEQSHHAFGLRTLQTLLDQECISQERIYSLAEEYLHLVFRVMQDMSDVFTELDEDPDEYIHSLINTLPQWIMPEIIGDTRPMGSE